jgi:hypothetical protein
MSSVGRDPSARKHDEAEPELILKMTDSTTEQPVTGSPPPS